MNKIKQEYIIASVALLLLGTVFVSSYFGSLGGEKYIKNNQAGALCSLLGIFCSCTPEAIPAGSIVSVDNENNTIEMTVPYGLSSMCFVPNIQTVYSKAVVTPDPSEPQDFINPVTYTINQDGFIKEYVVSVKLEPPNLTIPCVSSDPTNPNCWSTQASSTFIWGPTNLVTGAESTTDGVANAATLVAIPGDNYPAAEYCDALSEGGYTDWYLPAHDELLAGWGALGLGFFPNFYWSSTETPYASESRAFFLYTYGPLYMENADKYQQFSIRCLRGPSTVGLIVSSNTVIEGDTTTLTWTPTNSTSCTASGNDPYWDGSSLDAANGDHTWTTAPLTAGTYNYNISCTGNSGIATATMTVIAEHPTCSSFTYSTWSTCSSGIQTRTATSSSPANCTGGEPFISQSCASPLDWSPVLGTKSWTEADAFCKNPANDYQRLPTLEEGKTALADQFLGGGNNPGGFSSSNIYWTGDSVFETITNTLHRYYYYWSGYINYGSESGDGFPRNFRCVREPKTLVSLNTSASTVVEGNTAVITWTPTNSNSCIAGGNDPYWAGSSLLSIGGSHTWTTEALAVGTHTYNISCTGNNGTANATVVVTATPISTGGGATGGGGTGGGTIAPVSFDGGTGTESDPYQISDWKQLNSVRSKLSSYYILTSDLTSSSGGYADFGNNWTPIGNSGSIFNGRFNGNGKTISNLKINSSSAYYVGLFGYSTGNISNLGLIDITIISNSNYVGALVGLMGSGEINQSYSTGNISGLNYVGGLVGQQSGGEISNSYSSVNITNFTSNAGGLVGKQDTSGIITNSYSTGILSISTGDIPYGGLIGYQNPSDFYSSLKRVTGSYWDKNTSGLTGSAAGEGKTTTEMQTPSTFSGWDADIWTLVAGNYPTLDPSSLYIEPIVPVEPVVIINTADLNCTLSRISPPLTSSNEVSVNNNTVWKASSTCPTCTVNWSVTDTNNPNPTMTPGTNPWNKIFTTIGSKIVSAQFVSPGGTPGTTCTATTTVVQTGGGTEL